MEARMPMIETTIMSSINVKPRCFMKCSRFPAGSDDRAELEDRQVHREHVARDDDVDDDAQEEERAVARALEALDRLVPVGFEHARERLAQPAEFRGGLE